MVSTARNTIIDQKPSMPIFAEGNCPWKQERHLQIEDDEQDRHQVEADVELHAGIVERVEAALIGGKLFRIGIAVGHQERRNEQRKPTTSATPMNSTMGRYELKSAFMLRFPLAANPP